MKKTRAANPPLLLDDALKGIGDFKKRASNFSQEEWNFVLGYAHFSQERWEDAGKFFEGLEDKLPPVKDHILYHQAVIANRMNRPAEALKLCSELKKNHPTSVWFVPAKMEEAAALVALGRFPEARRVLHEYKKQVNEDKMFEADILIAQSLIGDGNSTEAVNYARSLALSSGSEEKLSELGGVMKRIKDRFRVDIRKWLDEPVQQYRLAKSFADRSQWDSAAARLADIIKNGNLDSGMRTEAKWLLARCLRSIHRYGESISLMEELLDDPNARGFADTVRSTLATTYTKKNEYEKAIAIRRRMMEESPKNSAMQAQMSMKIAFLYMDEGRYEDAIELWRSTLRLKSLGKQAATARWYLAWCNYMSGNYKTAAALFDAMLKGNGKQSKTRDRLLYWRGQALARTGKRPEARAAFLQVISSHPGGYYAELAKRRLERDERSVKNFAGVETSSIKIPSPIVPVRRRSSGGGEGQGEGKINYGSHPSHMAKAVFFDKLGIREEAAQELRAAGKEGGVSLNESLLALATQNFAHDLTYRMAESGHQNLLKGGGIPPGGSQKIVWEAAYPRAYEPVVGTLTSGSDVDPKFVWAIMRNESAFRPGVVSPAGAVGLMQLMPTTANRLAHEEGLNGVDRRDLYIPTTNISWGVAYLKKLSRLFPKNPVAWTASYNAGEEAVGRWLANGHTNDIEEWIEEIPYDETNLYVKKVMASYWRYQRLYVR